MPKEKNIPPPLRFQDELRLFTMEGSTSQGDARPGQPAVYRLSSKPDHFNLSAILQLPAAALPKKITPPREVLAYVMVMGHQTKCLPALLPCMVKLNKDGSTIKTWRPFLTRTRKKQESVLTASQQQLNALCHQLLKIIEKQPGRIAETLAAGNRIDRLCAIFGAWQAMMPALKHQPFLYAYRHEIKELKGIPDKSRLGKINFSNQLPLLRFSLTDKGPFYRLHLQVWINNQLLPEYDAGPTLFINNNSNFYLLSCLRDAALAEWMHRCGGGLTIFKEQFEHFEKEILIPLQDYYPVDKPKAGRKKR